MDFNLKCVLFLTILSVGWVVLLIISESLEKDLTIFAVAMVSFKYLDATLKIMENKDD